MTTVTWVATYNGTSPTGYWSGGANWSTGQVPGVGDDVSLPLYVEVALTSDVVVNSLTLGAVGDPAPVTESPYPYLDASASLDVTGNLAIDAGSLILSADESLNGGTISLLAFFPPVPPSFEIPLQSALTVDGTLTLGASEGMLVKSDVAGLYGTGSVVNDGTIDFGVIPFDLSVTGYVNSFLTVSVASFDNEGTIGPGFGELSFATGTTLTNGGIISASGGTLDIAGAIAGSGTIDLAGGTTVEIGGGYGQQIFDFLDATSTLALGDASGTNTVRGFVPGSTIEIVGAAATPGFASGTLDLSNGVSLDARFVLPGVPASAVFHADMVGKDTFVTETIPCFRAGTRVLTASGEVAVEALASGDLLMTVSGQGRSVRWIGHRHVDCHHHRKPQDVWPIRVQAGAFGTNLPHRDLRLSPDHAVLIDGVLIPIRYLINGKTIVQEQMDEVTYYHVELDQHDVLLAEGLPCESYLDTGNRSAFANGGDEVMLHPDFALKVWETKACAQLVVNGPKLAAVKAMVLAQALAHGYRVMSDPRLRIVADGRTLPPKITGNTWSVSLAPGVQSVRLISRAWVSAHVLADSNDTRMLGVAIANVRLDGTTLALDDPRLCSGWHVAEAQWRWTDGDAVLALAGVRELAFNVVMTGSYWEAPPELEKVRVL